MLTYKRSDNLEVVCYTDADLASDEDDITFTSGYVYMLARGAISWRSGKQGLTAVSTMQAEFMSCYDSTGHAVCVKNFIPALVKNDNTKSARCSLELDHHDTEPMAYQRSRRNLRQCLAFAWYTRMGEAQGARHWSLLGGKKGRRRWFNLLEVRLRAPETETTAE